MKNFFLFIFSCFLAHTLYAQNSDNAQNNEQLLMMKTSSVQKDSAKQSSQKNDGNTASPFYAPAKKDNSRPLSEQKDNSQVITPFSNSTGKNKNPK
jgi:hypothetical protein